MARQKPRPSRFGNLGILPSGRWRARYRDPLHPGKWINAPITFTSKEDGRAWLDDIEHARSKGIWKHPDQIAAEALAAAEEAKRKEAEAQRDALTLNEWTVTWLAILDAQKESGDIAPGTWRSHRSRIKRLQSALGERPIRTITETDLVEWWDNLILETGRDGKPLSGNTRNGALATATKCLNAAYARGLTPTKLEPNVPRAPKKTELPLEYVATPDDIEKMVALAHGKGNFKVGAAIMLAYYAGLRNGEVRALRRRDVILTGKNPHLRITRTTSRGTSETIREVPKSQAGNRTIAIIPTLKTHLSTYLLEHVGKDQDDLLFPAALSSRRPMKDQTLLDSAGGFHEVRKAIKLHSTLDGLHELRKCFLTRFGRMPGVTLKDLMDIGGHRDVASVMVYQVSERGRLEVLMAGMEPAPNEATVININTVRKVAEQ